MLLLFRRNLFSNIIGLLLFIIALLSYYFFHPSEFVVHDFGQGVGEFIDSKSAIISSKYLQFLLAIVLIFWQALLISNIVIKHKLSRMLSLVPGAVFVLYCITCLQPELMHIILLANLFFVFAIINLFAIYKKHHPISSIFNAGFLLGCAALIYPPYWIYIIVFFLGLISLRSINLLETLQLLLAYACPYFLFGTANYYWSSFDLFVDYLKPGFYLHSLDFKEVIPWLKPVLILIISVLYVYFQDNLRKKKKFDALKKIELSYWTLLIGSLSIFLLESPDSSHLIVLSVPFSIIGGLILEGKEGSVTKEFIYILGIGFYLALLFKVF